MVGLLDSKNKNNYDTEYLVQEEHRDKLVNVQRHTILL